MRLGLNGSWLLSGQRMLILFTWLTHSFDLCLFECILNWLQLLELFICCLLLDFGLLLSYIWFTLWDRRQLRARILVLSFLKQVLWFTVEIILAFLFGASVASDSSCEIIVLALTADPSSIRECKIILLLHLLIWWLCLSLVKLWHDLLLGSTSYLLLLLILSPL